jgi:hypothetical protein
MAPQNESAEGEVRDQRIDRGITWALTTVAALAFGIGGWAFTGLTGEVRGMRDDLAKFSTRVAVLETGDMPNRIRVLEAHDVEHGGKLADLERRLLQLETHGGK